MIEVEKKFQPTEEQLDVMLADAEFVGEVVNHDILYDYPDYKLFKQHIRMRNRNGSFEMKIPAGDFACTELGEPEEIKKYFNTTQPLQDFVAENMIVFTDFTTHRRKYKKGEFNIDVDHVESVYDVCEIEIMVEKEDQINDARERILKFALSYGFEVKNIPEKRELNLKHFNPSLYKELYGDK